MDIYPLFATLVNVPAVSVIILNAKKNISLGTKVALVFGKKNGINQYNRPTRVSGIWKEIRYGLNLPSLVLVLSTRAAITVSLITSHAPVKMFTIAEIPKSILTTSQIKRSLKLLMLKELDQSLNR